MIFLVRKLLGFNGIRDPRGGVEKSQLEELIVAIQDVSLTSSRDRWVWELNGTGDFSVSSIRNLIDSRLLPKGDFNTKWIRHVPIKVNTIAWKVMTNSLPTRFNISRRGIDIDSISCVNSGPVTGLGDLPENCLATILANLDPPDISSTADFIWEPKLPENYRTLAEKLMFYEGCSEACLVKKKVYAGLCSPVRFSSGTKEVWLDKERGGICIYWTHIPTLQSRFHAIAYLQQIWWLEVEGDLEFSLPAGIYSLFFRLRLGRPSEGQDRKSSSTTQQVHGWNIKPVRDLVDLEEYVFVNDTELNAQT
nr:hypothetical protein [Tanacetum cinerariifolium]